MQAIANVVKTRLKLAEVANLHTLVARDQKLRAAKIFQPIFDHFTASFRFLRFLISQDFK